MSKKIISSITMSCIAAAGVVGCGGEAPVGAAGVASPGDEPLAMVTASAEAALTTGVIEWRVYSGGAPLVVEVVGVGAHEQVVSHAVARATMSENGSLREVAVESDFPEVGGLRVTHDREIIENTFEQKDYAARVLLGMFEDFDRFSKQPGTSAVGNALIPAAGQYVALGNNPYTLNSSELIDMPWTFFGFSYNDIKGWGCDNGFTRTVYEAGMIQGTGNCYVIAWLTDDPYDCRVNVHVGQGAFHAGTCLVTVYRDGWVP